MIKMAYKNIFRNKRRTILTITSVVIGIVGIVFGLAYINGIEAMLEEEGVRMSGDVRITAADYDTKSKIMDPSSNIPYKDLRKKIEKYPETDHTSAKILLGGYIFFKDKDEKAAGYGVEAGDTIEKYIYEGRYLNMTNKNEIIIGDKLKKRLGIKLGDEVTILTSTIDSSFSAQNYKVVGFYFLNPQVNRGFYIGIESAQYLLDIGEASTELLVYSKDKSMAGEIKKRFIGDFKGKYTSKLWDEIGINAFIKSMYPPVKVLLMLVLLILSNAVISNTMIMAVFERRKELGVLKALGMSNGRIVRMFCIEGMIMGIAGSIIGVAAGGGMACYFSQKGIYLGSAVSKIMEGVNFGETLYPRVTIGLIVLGAAVGMTASLIATIVPVIPELKKQAVENISGV